MDGDSTEPKKFSYPNADRGQNDSGEILGPKTTPPKNLQEELRPTIHLTDALQAKVPDQKPSDMQTIHTFQSDVANAVKNDNVSLIKIALAEKKRQQRQGTFDQTLSALPTSKNYTLWITLIIIILFAGGGYILFSVLTPKEEVINNPGSRIVTPPLEAELDVTSDIRGKDSNDIERFIQAEKAAELPLGSMKRINFVRTDDLGIINPVPAPEWLTFMRVRAPDTLIRAFDPGFIFGIYSLTPHDSFIILKVNSYDNAFAGMLAWEPNMEDDIGGVIINKDINVITDDNGIATSTNQFDGKPFVDRVLNNKDARVLYNNNGKPKIIYTFVDQETLVIVSSESVLKEVVFRLTTGRISR